MVYMGLVLQSLGMALILVGGFKAVREMGEVERWWTSTKLWVGDRVRGLKTHVARIVRRKRDPVELSGKMEGFGTGTGILTLGAVGEAPWESMDQDEKIAKLKKRVDALRDLVDRNDERTSGRLDGVEASMAEFESTVDERFGGHDARDLSILRYQIVGGSLILFGTVLVWLG